MLIKKVDIKPEIVDSRDPSVSALNESYCIFNWTCYDTVYVYVVHVLNRGA